MKNSLVETITGAVVLLAAVIFLVFGLHMTGSGGGGTTYLLKAEFSKVGELAVGGDVRISGIKVGRVLDLSLNPTTYNAVASLEIQRGIDLPLDSSARIESAGLLGGNYVSLSPGAELEVLADGERIEFTQGAFGLMDIVAEVLFAGGNETTDP